VSELFGVLQSALDPRGPQAARIADLWWLLLAGSVFAWVAIVAALALALWRPGRQPTTDIEAPEPGKRTAVAAGAGVSALVLAVLAAASVATGRAVVDAPRPDERPLTVTAIGRQWWWEFRYDDAVPGRMFTTANELHVPVGRPVIVRATSHDVIHSFWVPSLHGKIDLVPGGTNTLWFEADRPGEYRGQCAEFCGLQHAKMAFVVVAVPDADYQRWAERQRQPAEAPADDLARRGEQVFLANQCVLCHRVRGTIAGGRIAPDLTRVGSRRTLAAGTLRNTRGGLAGWIVDPQQIKPGSHMPPTNLAPDDLQALLAYLEGLR
jgi:cytochrome c oxidase subunit 2